MRIAALVHQFPPDFQTGTEILCLRTMQALAGKGHEVRVLAADPLQPAGRAVREDRVEGVAVTGLEIQADLAALAAENAAANGLAGRVRFLAGAVEDPPPGLAAARFDHVMMNPPFFVEGTDDAPPDPGKRLAHIADAEALARWVTCARTCLAPRGRLTAILPVERRVALYEQTRDLLDEKRDIERELPLLEQELSLAAQRLEDVQRSG